MGHIQEKTGNGFGKLWVLGRHSHVCVFNWIIKEVVPVSDIRLPMRQLLSMSLLQTWSPTRTTGVWTRSRRDACGSPPGGHHSYDTLFLHPYKEEMDRGGAAE
jgi:hypothetical protein